MCAAEKGEKRKVEGIEDNPITFAKQIFHPSLSDFTVWSFCDTPPRPTCSILLLFSPHTCVLSRARAMREGRLLLVVIVVVEKKYLMAILLLSYNYTITIL